MKSDSSFRLNLKSPEDFPAALRDAIAAIYGVTILGIRANLTYSDHLEAKSSSPVTSRFRGSPDPEGEYPGWIGKLTFNVPKGRRTPMVNPGTIEGLFARRSLGPGACFYVWFFQQDFPHLNAMRAEYDRFLREFVLERRREKRRSRMVEEALEKRVGEDPKYTALVKKVEDAEHRLLKAKRAVEIHREAVRVSVERELVLQEPEGELEGKVSTNRRWLELVKVFSPEGVVADTFPESKPSL